MEMLDKIEIGMLSVIRAGLWGDDLPLTEVADAEGIYKELKAHTVAFLPDKMPGNETNWQAERAANIAYVMRLSYVQQKCFEVLEAAGINAVVLKGSAAAVYYPQPERRTFGDIDLLVREVDFERSASTIAALSGEKLIEGNTFGRHIGFTVDGVPIELHRYFADDPALDALLKQAIPHAQTAELFGMRFGMLPSFENGLVILDHIRRHLIEGQLGLRQVIDWMMYVHAELSEKERFESFLKEARVYRLETLAVHLTQLCRKYLGLPGETIQVEDETICDELMCCILESGNFGKKNKTVERNTLLVMNEMRAHPFRTLQQAGMKNWEALQRHSWLKPFAWVYQLFRYLKHGLSRDRAMFGVAADLAKSRRQTKLFRQLGLEGYTKTENQ